MTSLSPATKLLRELIAIPSVNPAFVPPDDPRAGEAAMADYLAAVAAQNSLDIAFNEIVPRRKNIVARLEPSGPIKQTIILAPHLDTVGDTGESAAQFAPSLQGDRLFGRGACDTKGSVAAMLTAIMNIASAGERPKETELLFLGLIDEEHNQLGSRAVAGSGLTASLAIVGEPTRLKVVTAHKGLVWLRLSTAGKSAHGSRPELGDNAIAKMARAVSLIEGPYAKDLRKKRHPLLGSPTVNVGKIYGGMQPNIVPAECHIEIDRRTLPGETPASVQREITACLKQKGVSAKMSHMKSGDSPPMETDPSNPFAGVLMKAAKQRKPSGVDYFCDAAILASGGIPSIVFGPGDIAQAHTPNEWISLKSLDASVAILERFLRQLP